MVENVEIQEVGIGKGKNVKSRICAFLSRHLH